MLRAARGVLLASLILAVQAVSPLHAFQAETLQSVVSVLPLWPGHEQGGAPNLRPGQAPEGSAVAVAPGGYGHNRRHSTNRKRQHH